MSSSNLKHAKKMVLVDPRELERINDAVTLRPKKIEEATADKLETDMKRTLDRGDLTDGDTMRLYHQLLQRFLQKDRMKEPLSITVKNVKEGEEEKTSSTPVVSERDSLEQKVLKAVPPTFKTRAKSLLSHLRENKSKGHVDWTADGELVASGKQIRGSNMVDLIHDSLKARKGSKDPVGLEPFMEALILNETPDALITNVKRRRALKESTSPAAAKKPKKSQKKRQSDFPYDGKLWELY